MTQPPQPPQQPPNEPPKGGFGAPQEPPAGGFGAPQEPPAGGFGKAPEPSYGYPGAPAPQTPPPAQPPAPPAQPPQAPATPPPAAPPAAPPTVPAGQPQYGYPQQAPQAPGYGYPGQPGQPGQPGAQPTYGYPGQQQYPQQYQPQPPTMPMQPQPTGGGSGGKKVSKQMMIVTAAVVAIALIVGGGFWYSSSQKDDTQASSEGSSGGKDGKGGSGGEKTGEDGQALPEQGPAKEKAPADAAARIVTQLPQPEIPKDQIWNATGSVLTDDVYAKSGINEVNGYDPDTGKKKWTIPLSGMTCAMSREVTKDGIAAVVTEEAKRNKKGDYQQCTNVSAIDLKSGRKLWTESVESSGMKATFKEVTISGTTIAAGAGTSNGGAAWDVSGKSLWTPKVGQCKDVGYAGGDQLVAVRKCGTYGDEKLKIQLLDPKTGDDKWTYPIAPGVDNAKIISTNPVVFGQDTTEITATGVTDVFSLGNNGKLRAKISLEEKKYDHNCEVNKVNDCSSIAVGNDRLYVPTRPHDGGSGSYGQTNEIVSFSLATGKPTSDRADAGDSEIFPIRMDGPNVLAYKAHGYKKGAQVVSLDGKTMKETKLLETPGSEAVTSAISGMVPQSNELLYGNGHLFLGKKLLSKPYSKDEKEYVAIGFMAK
ncbi:PQQ-binding-like beta-propeller repeat protein [Streptomyces sp. NPDC087300]|uniref:outer membrane protein assembly factor BamB family protein n=1 Tax=Streptomyces sp. NPDC087300 TaxID=3365780 RepID=UPI00382019C3